MREKASPLGINKERNLLNSSSLAFKARVGCLGKVLVPGQAELLLCPGSAALLVLKALSTRLLAVLEQASDRASAFSS